MFRRLLRCDILSSYFRSMFQISHTKFDNSTCQITNWSSDGLGSFDDEDPLSPLSPKKEIKTQPVIKKLVPALHIPVLPCNCHVTAM